MIERSNSWSLLGGCLVTTKVLDRNDVRVAEVWMDEYKTLFYTARGLSHVDFGDVSDRRALRERKCVGLYS